MTRESVREWTQRLPFIPFVIRMSNGAKYPVRHSDLVVPTLDVVLVAIMDHDRQDRAWDRFRMLSMLHITHIVPLKEEPEESPVIFME